MINRAVSEGRLISNPIRDAAGKNLVKKLPELQAKKRFLDREEIQRLLKAAEDQPLWRNIIGVALTSGLRRAEVQHLIWDNVDFKRRILTVGNHEGFTTKNRRERSINMNESLVKILSGIERRGQYVFGAKNGEKPFTSHFNQKFNEIVKKAKIQGITFHDLRHTFAPLLVQAGHSLPVVKEFMGHSSINVTMIYAHTSEQQKREAVASLGLLPS